MLFLAFQSINIEHAGTLKILKIVNYSTVGISLGNLVIDIIKMPFTFDKMFSEEKEEEISVGLPSLNS